MDSLHKLSYILILTNLTFLRCSSISLSTRYAKLDILYPLVHTEDNESCDCGTYADRNDLGRIPRRGTHNAHND